MISPEDFVILKNNIERNKLKINYLTNINGSLEKRIEIKDLINSLTKSFSTEKKNEDDRQKKYNQYRKNYLMDLKFRATELCRDHSKLLHQIEHVQWHLNSTEKSTHQHHHHSNYPHYTSPPPSTTTLPPSSSIQSGCHQSYGNPMNNTEMAKLQDTSKRLIKYIVGLRKKIFLAREKLDEESRMKKDMEKRLGELRKDISRQKKVTASSKRDGMSNIYLPAIKRSSAVYSK